MGRRLVIVTIAVSVLTVGCGSGSSQGERVVSRPSQPGGLASLPTGSATSDFWVAGRLPSGYDFVSAVDSPGPNGRRVYASDYSKDPTHDQTNAPLSIFSSPNSLQLNAGRPTVVRGHKAVLAPLTDEGRAYGVTLSWRERRDLTVVVEAREGVSLTDARLVADHIRPVSPAIWRRLVIATADFEGRAKPGMTRSPVTSGSIHGHRWTLTALLPPGYPLLAVDRRAACYELAYRGERSNGSACWQHPSWVRLGGQVFVFGEASPAVNQVVVRPSNGGPVSVDAHRINRFPPARFWVTPMPTGTCTVDVEPADHPNDSDVRTMGQTGPLTDQTADSTRCFNAPPPPPNQPPTTAHRGQVPPASALAPPTPPPKPTATVPTTR